MEEISSRVPTDLFHTQIINMYSVSSYFNNKSCLFVDDSSVQSCIYLTIMGQYLFPIPLPVLH